VDHLTRLLIAARDGDRVALERFVAETQADVWKLCRYVGDVAYADDLVAGC
jgi:RNA polymerase sigma-70 factor (ECF subfamily)